MDPDVAHDDSLWLTVIVVILADLAVQHKCGRFEWMVLDWKKTAIDFYEGMDASVLDKWRVCRLDKGKLGELAKQLDTIPQG